MRFVPRTRLKDEMAESVVFGESIVRIAFLQSRHGSTIVEGYKNWMIKLI
jgi:hypothetical protein